MVPRSLIIDCLKTYGEVIKVILNIMENWNGGENPARDLPGRCVITITICNSGDATGSPMKRTGRYKLC